MENQKIAIWVKSKGRSVKAVASLAKIPVAERPEYQLVTFTMRPLTWGANNEFLRLSKRSKRVKGFLISETDQYQYEAEKFLWALMGWDYKDASGQLVPMTLESINRLHENVYDAILAEYDKLNYLSKNEEKQMAIEISNYIQSQASGTNTVSPPSEVVEQSLMERFRWTPDQIDGIGLKRMQKIFAAMNQKEASVAIAKEQAQEKQKRSEEHKKGKP